MKVQAYGVHLLTGLGAALGLWSIILIYDGYYQEAIWILALSVIIDSVDGTLARYFKTKKYAPKIDGALMDNIIDFLTWTIAPLAWIYATMDIPLWVLLICALSSVFGFSNKDAKTSDDYFLGFPSYWNIVVFYIYLLNLPDIFASAILLTFCIVTFLPVKFIYPTRTPFLRPLTLALGSMFTIQLALLIYYFDKSPMLLIYSSFLFPFYYFGLSFYMNIRQNETSL